MDGIEMALKEAELKKEAEYKAYLEQQKILEEQQRIAEEEKKLNEQKKLEEEAKQKALEEELEALEKELLEMNSKKEEEVVVENKEENTKKDFKSIDLSKKTNLPLEDKEEIIMLIEQMEDVQKELADARINLAQMNIEKQYAERLAQQEAEKNQTLFEENQNLKREIKKAMSSAIPEDLSELIDYYKLSKENPTIYNQRNLVGRTAHIVEQITGLPLDNYIMDWLKKGSSMGEPSGGSVDLPVKKNAGAVQNPFI